MTYDDPFPNEYGDAAIESQVLRREAEHVVRYLTSRLDELDRDELGEVMSHLTRAANAIYNLTKNEVTPRLLAHVKRGDSVGVADGSKVLCAARFETEVLDGEALTDWLTEAGVDEPWVEKRDLSKQARDRIRSAVLDDGEQPPGVSADWGSPYLQVRKRG